MAASPDPSRPVIEQLDPRHETCPVHGPYVSKGTRLSRGLEIWRKCPSCESELAAQAQAQQERELISEMQVAAGIPSRFMDRGLGAYLVETLPQNEVLDAARAYAASFRQHLRTGHSLVLIGGVGTGKTHLACGILQDLMPVHAGRYFTASDLIDTIRDTWRRNSAQSPSRLMAELASVPLLVIDEVGASYGSESEKNSLFHVIDRRYRERRPMLLAGNVTVPELQVLLGDRSFDRLREVATVVPLDWESFRPQARKAAA
jgi:DNA replication protein DnaC